MKKFLSLFHAGPQDQHAQHGVHRVCLPAADHDLAGHFSTRRNQYGHIGILFSMPNPDKILENALREHGGEDEQFVESEEALLAALDESKKGVGLVFEGNLDDPQITIYTQGPVAEENINLLMASMDLIIEGMQGGTLPENYSIELLSEPSKPVPF